MGGVPDGTAAKRQARAFMSFIEAANFSREAWYEAS
jgi:hypothetical protein